jgi:hypothetical protein
MSDTPTNFDNNSPVHLPAPGRNNLWFRSSAGPTVIIFVHGVLSDSRTCWLSTTTEEPCYWPALLDKDPRFTNISIYLGGYYTSVDAGHYDIRNSADELFNALKRRNIDGSASVVDKQNLIFVCHSTGGIVVRYMLVNRYDFFAKKAVGVVLIASPSYGSRWANWLGVLTSLYGHKVGEQLKEGSWSLRDLDAQFRTLINERKIPQLCGVEAYENHFVIHNKWIPNTNTVVSEDSAGRYFGPPILLRNTDHFSSVKPDTFDHPAYELLVDFCQTHSDMFLTAAHFGAPRKEGRSQ